MLEIYNEVARDLLDSNSGKKKAGLKIRQHPKRGFYGESHRNQIIHSRGSIPRGDSMVSPIEII
jgi:hypothetical protein